MRANVICFKPDNKDISYLILYLNVGVPIMILRGILLKITTTFHLNTCMCVQCPDNLSFALTVFATVVHFLGLCHRATTFLTEYLIKELQREGAK